MTFFLIYILRTEKIMQNHKICATSHMRHITKHMINNKNGCPNSGQP